MHCNFERMLQDQRTIDLSESRPLYFKNALRSSLQCAVMAQKFMLIILIKNSELTLIPKLIVISTLSLKVSQFQNDFLMSYIFQKNNEKI